MKTSSKLIKMAFLNHIINKHYVKWHYNIQKSNFKLLKLYFLSQKNLQQQGTTQLIE